MIAFPLLAVLLAGCVSPEALQLESARGAAGGTLSGSKSGEAVVCNVDHRRQTVQSGWFTGQAAVEAAKIGAMQAGRATAASR